MSLQIPPEPDSLRRIAVLIPAWQPAPILPTLAEALRAAGIGHVLVVDDGSDPDLQPLFDQLARTGVTVLRHAVNLGKGRALKTGFNHLLLHRPDLLGVVTADADGQHTVEDILSVARALVLSAGRPVLGVRAFSGDVPFRSRLGNTLTRSIFTFVTGVRLADTQTGLRGLPPTALSGLMTLDGERYEYEMTVLAHLCRDGSKPLQVPIRTVYIDANRSSHFNPVWDSMRIYFVLARFYLSSLLAAAVDFAGFSIAFAATQNLAVSVATGRLSSLVNFTLNRRFVFRNRGPVTAAIWRYYALVAVIACLSYGLIYALTYRLGWNVFLAKVLVESALSLVSFSIQRTFIFRRSEAV
ncbi:bifunctional glycosyltransferase family 2/GtrA family protein [Granulicella sp. 5B5]|uniref:bifunctional glycosyltransferase family 2/GtrA family protein n=1 Tax=Granulicella sp. 5B5 TaxID=1617967 RepID=UPI0015F54AB6|nr:bifunctional glycosyltransferase family 2/GtrA family protein [Granulicella sp. 5B5]